MPEIQLGFTAVFGTEFDMLFATFIFHTQLVVRRGADNVAGIIGFRHMIDMAGVMQGMGDVRSVGVAVVESNRHFGTLDQREVNTIHIATIRFGKADGHAFLTLRFIILVSIEFDTV